MYLASLLRFPEVRISRSRFVVKLGLAKGKSRSTENDGGAEYQKTRSSDGYSEPMVGPWEEPFRSARFLTVPPLVHPRDPP